jgi:hypothetical protein
MKILLEPHKRPAYSSAIPSMYGETSMLKRQTDRNARRRKRKKVMLIQK